MDWDYHRDLREGTLAPPNPSLVWTDEKEGGMMQAHDRAQDMAGRFSAGWRDCYPEPALWVVRLRDFIALVPNSLYSTNLPWRDAVEWAKAANG